jgi:hypothetical protein
VINADFIEKFFLRLKNTYGLDVRALSLMRVAIAAVLLIDLSIRITSLTAHYTGAGTVPFTSVEMAYWSKGYFSLFSFCDEYWYVLLLFIATGIIYACMLLGYKTRLFTFLAWVMLTSLQNRNTLVLQGGDDELRLLIFWGMFLPWGNFYSLDSKNYFFKERTEKYLSVASLGYVMLIFSLYFFSGVLKRSSEWDWSEGSAVYYAFNLDQMAWPLAKTLLSYPAMLKVLSVTVKWSEILLPFLLFIPFRNTLFRMIFIFLIVSLHIGISLTLYVGLFYLISISCLIGLFSPSVMDKFDAKFKLNKNKLADNSRPSFLQSLRENYYFKVILNCTLFFFAALSMIWNFATVANSGLGVSDSFTSLGYVARLNQNWAMFSPTVLKDDGWYVMEGIKADRSAIDINREGKPVDYLKPKCVLDHIKDDRWRKFGENYMFAKNDFMRAPYCKYLLTEWNTNHPDNKIDSLNVVYVKEITPAPPGTMLIATKEILCGCKN